MHLFHNCYNVLKLIHVDNALTTLSFTSFFNRWNNNTNFYFKTVCMAYCKTSIENYLLNNDNNNQQ